MKPRDSWKTHQMNEEKTDGEGISKAIFLCLTSILKILLYYKQRQAIECRKYRYFIQHFHHHGTKGISNRKEKYHKKTIQRLLHFLRWLLFISMGTSLLPCGPTESSVPLAFLFPPRFVLPFFFRSLTLKFYLYIKINLYVLMRWLQLRFDIDSTAIRPRYDHSTTYVRWATALRHK